MTYYYVFKLASYGVLGNLLLGLQAICHAVSREFALSSDWGEIRVGVPQVGPLLFSVYMNDLPTVTKSCELNLYADNIEMFCHSIDLSCAEHDLQEDLNFVYSWLCVNLLSLSIKESNAMLVGSRQKLQNRDLNVTVDGKPLSRVSSFKYLGLYIDENLNWHEHTKNVLQRILSRLHLSFKSNTEGSPRQTI